MPIKKILIKNDAGNTLGTITLQTDQVNGVRFPSSFLPERYLKEGDVHPFLAGAFPAFSKEESLSVMGKYAGQRAFATTLGAEQAAFAKWRLLQEDQPSCSPDPSPLPSPTSPLQDPACEKEEIVAEPLQEAPLEESKIAPTEKERSQAQEHPAEQDPASRTENLLSRARRLIDAAPAFSLFEEMMPGSKWGITGEEGNLLGIVEEDPPRVLVGIPGTRDCPPETERPTSFFPTDDTGETGYFLSELIEEDLS